MSAFLDLTMNQIVLLGVICFAAGLVRGFAGFALSALVMASAATIISPISLIPVLWFLEMAASLQMAGGGWRDANRTIAILLVVGNFIGWPIGLSLTTSLPRHINPDRLVHHPRACSPTTRALAHSGPCDPPRHAHLGHRCRHRSRRGSCRWHGRRALCAVTKPTGKNDARHAGCVPVPSIIRVVPVPALLRGDDRTSRMARRVLRPHLNAGRVRWNEVLQPQMGTLLPSILSQPLDVLGVIGSDPSRILKLIASREITTHAQRPTGTGPLPARL